MAEVIRTSRVARRRKKENTLNFRCNPHHRKSRAKTRLDLLADAGLIVLDMLVLRTLADLVGGGVAGVDILDQEATAVGDRLDGCCVLVEDIDLLQ